MTLKLKLTGFLLAGCAALPFAPVAYAQDAGTIVLDQITIQGGGQEDPKAPVKGYVARSSATATKTGTSLLETQQSISVITADQLKAQGVETLGQALNYTPGISGQPFGADPRFDSPNIRGFDGRQNQYLNGLKLMRTAGAPSVDVYGLERIEVLRGPASVLYGQGNPAGIINMVSKRPVFEAFGEVGAQIGSFDHYGSFFDVGGPVGREGNLAYRLTGMGRTAGEQTDYLNDDRYFIAPAFTWKPDEDTSLTILTSVQHDNPSTPSGLPPQLTFNAAGNRLPRDFYIGDRDFDDSSRTMINLGYELEHRFSDTWTLRQNARYTNFEWDYQAVNLSVRGLDPDGHTMRRSTTYQDESLNTYNIDNQLQGEFSTGPVEHTLLMGLDFRYFDNHALTEFGTAPSLDANNPVYGMSIPKNLTFRSDIESSLRQTGIYLQDELTYDNWRATFGLRQDWASSDSSSEALSGIVTDRRQDDNKLTGRAGLSYVFDNGIAPYVSYATSFEPVVGQAADGNALVPTTGEQVELGIKYQPAGWDGFFSAAIFDLRQKNVLTSVVSNGVSRDAQIGEVRVKGLELEGVASIADGLDLRAAYTYLDAEVVGGTRDGFRPENVPEHAASLWLDYTFQDNTPLEGLGMGAGIRYVGTRFGNAANTFEMDGVALVDASIHYQKNGYKATLNVQNIADKNYVANCGSFGCYYGEGRTVMGKVSYAW